MAKNNKKTMNSDEIRKKIASFEERRKRRLDGISYSTISSGNPNATDILAKLASLIKSEQFTAELNGSVLSIASASVEERQSMTLSPNLTTQSVIGIIHFSTLDVGDVYLPNNTITEIKTAIPGLISINNLLSRIAGNLRETDSELRASYIAKIFQRSSRMNESIRAAILQNVQGILFCDVKDNPTNQYDAYGRPPHSVEAIIDGGDDIEIALQILNTKAGGITAFGNTNIDLILNNGENLTIGFTRPTFLYIWFKVTVTSLGNLPTDYADTIKAILSTGVTALGNVDEIAPQQFIGEMFRQIPNIGHIEIPTFHSTDPNAVPAEFTENAIPISTRQRAVTDAARIEVVLSGK